MDYSFPHYLLAKQTVDDRALNRQVYETLLAELGSRVSSAPQAAFEIIEVGAGIGTMLTRLLRWGFFTTSCTYTLVDELPENLDYARAWLPRWGREHGWQVETDAVGLRFSTSKSASISVAVRLLQADVFDFIRSSPEKADLLIAHAFLDLLPMPASLVQLFSLLKPQGLAWLTINFDGVTSLEPPIRFSAPESAPASSASISADSDAQLVSPIRSSASESAPGSAASISADSDAQLVSPIRFSASKSTPASVSLPADVDGTLERLYHQSMDARPTGGDSQAGRHLFQHLEQAGGEILAAGASDWVVYPTRGSYPADEAYFLHFILHFFELSLAGNPELDPEVFAAWLAARQAQVERGELTYIAHQMDFLARSG